MTTEAGSQGLNEYGKAGRPGDAWARQFDMFKRPPILVAAITCQLLVAAARAAEGDIDTSFGDQGVVSLSSFPSGVYFPLPPLVQRDMKIVACANETTSDGTGIGTVLRFMPDGQRDTTFGDDGRTEIPTFEWSCTSVQQRSDDKIVISGSVFNGTPESASWASKLVSIDADGTLDTLFGIGGFSDIDGIAFGNGGPEAMSLHRDDSVVLASPLDPNTFAVARVRPDGFLDPSFGDGGGAAVAFPGTAYPDVRKIFFDDRDRITLVGSVGIEGTERTAFAATRLLHSGEPDPSFGDGGRAIFELSDTASLLSAAQEIDGNIVMVGSMRVGESLCIAIIRMTVDGGLDYSFGDDGEQVLSINGMNDTIHGVLATAAGTLVLAGFTKSSETIRDGLLIQLDHQGNPIPTFGTNGVKTYRMLHERTYFAGIAEQDRNFIIYGMSFPGPIDGTTFFLTRIEGPAQSLGHSRHARPAADPFP